MKETNARVREAIAEYEVRLEASRAREKLAMARALVLFAVFVVLAMAVRAGAERVLYSGWWKQW